MKQKRQLLNNVQRRLLSFGYPSSIVNEYRNDTRRVKQERRDIVFMKRGDNIVAVKA